MNETRITIRKVALFSAVGLSSTLVGGALAKIAIRQFAGTPAWEMPAIVVGAIAALVVTAIVLPTFLEARRRARDKI